MRSRKITNAECATLLAWPEWNYSCATDILGRIVEVVSGKTLGAFLAECILAPLRMTETAFDTAEQNAARLVEAVPADGEKVQLFKVLENSAIESSGGGLVATIMDYARFSQMLLNGGSLNGNR